MKKKGKPLTDSRNSLAMTEGAQELIGQPKSESARPGALGMRDVTWPAGGRWWIGLN